MGDNIIDMLDSLADQQKDWKRGRSAFKAPSFIKKSSPTPKSVSPEDVDV